MTINVKRTGQIHLPKREPVIAAGLDLDFTKAATAAKEDSREVAFSAFGEHIQAIAWSNGQYVFPNPDVFIAKLHK